MKYHVIFRTDCNMWRVWDQNYGWHEGYYATLGEALDYASELSKQDGGLIQIHPSNNQ